MESRWTLGIQLNRVEQLPPTCLQRGATNKKQTGFPNRTSKKPQKLELPSICEGRTGAEEATNKRICGMSVFHPPPAQGYCAPSARWSDICLLEAGWVRQHQVEETARMRRTQGNSVELCTTNDKSSSAFPACLLPSRRPQDFFRGTRSSPKDF